MAENGAIVLAEAEVYDDGAYELDDRVRPDMTGFGQGFRSPAGLVALGSTNLVLSAACVLRLRGDRLQWWRAKEGWRGGLSFLEPQPEIG
jgi:hypothetical protein